MEQQSLSEKYGLTATHSEVLAAMETISAPCKVLDLGCGRGRNSLYLAQRGFDVTAVDQNAGSIATLTNIVDTENLPVKTALYDINSAALRDHYDFILSTVVFMFLDREQIPQIIKNMQAQTNSGGYNLIVSAMDTADTPCPVPFSFTFKENELKNYYQGWEFIKYNELPGELHRRDENGNRIKLKFVTMLARKP